jgi:CYTH domain-containing protein
MSRNPTVSSKEIEQRYAVDHTSGLYLPKEYKNYHQAELWSWKVREVVETFTGKTEAILSHFPKHKNAILALLNKMNPCKPLKIRIRIITDWTQGTKHSEFTLKQKTPNDDYKIYDEYNLPIDNQLAIELIEHIAPALIVPGDNSVEYWVNKNRYITLWPDGKPWDLDVYQRLNTGLFIAEIEVDWLDVKIKLPPYIKKRMNGYDIYKPFWTGELQKVPFQLMPPSLRERFLIAQWLSHRK